MRILLLAATMFAAPTPPANDVAEPAAQCEAIAPLLNATRVCAETGRGIVIARDQARAQRLVALALAGEARFTQRFGQAAPRYAVVEMTSGTPDRALDDGLKKAGYASRLPWLSEAAMADAYRALITRATEAKAHALGLGAEQTAQLVKAALDQQAGKLDPVTSRAREAGTLPHELGHGWLIHGYWPDAKATPGDHYGGPRPTGSTRPPR